MYEELNKSMQTVQEIVTFLSTHASSLSPIIKAELISTTLDATVIIDNYVRDTITKGWLPSGTSQNDLPDSSFLWLSSDYTSGKSTDKSSGRKFPVKGPNGSVDPKGWMAAHNILEGGMGGGNFTGGPSHDEVVKKLMACKPSEISVDDGKASVTKADDEAGPHPLEADDDYTGAVISKAYIPITKADDELGIIFGKASVADIFDSQGHRIKAYELEKAAYNFMAKANKRATNTHKGTIPGAFVASWVEDGVWQIGFKPDDKNIAKAAKRGDFVGWSIGGVGDLIPALD